MQGQATVPLEGLPYWILWVLLCIIVLLLAFIFLRDKDLRVRVDEFLSGAKKRVKRTQLRILLKREERRKDVLLGDLGKRAWSERLPGEAFEVVYGQLDVLGNESAARRTELNDLDAEIRRLREGLEEARQKHKLILKPATGDGRRDPAALQAVKDEEKRLAKEIREDEQKMAATRTALKTIESQRSVQFHKVGALVDDIRPDHKDFLGLYVQIDKLNRSILRCLNETEHHS